MMNNKGKIILGALILVIILFAVFTHETISHNSKADSVKRSDSYIQEEEEKPEVAGARRLTRDSFDGSLTFDGIKYEANSHIDTVLFLGIDSSNQEREGVGISGEIWCGCGHDRKRGTGESLDIRGNQGRAPHRV